jgi:hypothetical protein
VWVTVAPIAVWLIPSPKFHATLLIDAEEGVSITVNAIGDPAVPTLSDVATETDKLIGLVVR